MSAQEVLRKRVLDQAPSVFTVLGGHFATSASLPSGLDDIVGARDILKGLISSMGMSPSVDYVSGCYPALAHLNEPVDSYPMGFSWVRLRKWPLLVLGQCLY